MSKDTAFVVRYTMRPETADANQELVENVFAELSRKRPEGVRYASLRLADGVTFVHVAIIEEGAMQLTDLAAFQEFQKGFAERADGTPQAGPATVVGSWGFAP
ncbi:hypothetical protein [Streptomyces yaizuensis]|uniref:ABM domain-containing protein n=1 Tax=Streptomyces yaizuensis TaxID=2989713 RepID=A0ABQ5P860_9ACTN|nr:hypothetical protein [Streptomyces sp. YSPA8]GLF98776.1 hypothetical protein SYYSPA8_30785 [Streptomyces sp. YSPA8]